MVLTVLPDSLSKDGVQLLGNVILFVFDFGFPQFDDDIGIGLAIDISGMQICGLENVSCWLLVKSTQWPPVHKSMQSRVLLISAHSPVTLSQLKGEFHIY